MKYTSIVALGVCVLLASACNKTNHKKTTKHHKASSKETTKTVVKKAPKKDLKSVNPFLAKIAPHLKTCEGKNFSESSIIPEAPTLIYFSASWCGPCRKVSPLLVAKFNEYKAKGVNIILAGNDANETKMLEYMEHYKMPWNGISKEFQGQFGFSQYEMEGIPSFALVDVNGKLIQKGYVNKLKEMIAKVKKAPQK